MSIVRVDTGSHFHDVLIGPLEAGIERLSGGRPVPLVSDGHVLALHGDKLAALDPIPLLVPRGEEAKRWSVLEDLLTRLAAIDPDRETPVIALGGGSVGDVAGLAAALFKRGCPLVHIPTTLLAQADSAVGGKTAIDFAGVKNLVGTFYQPALVVADPALLATLDPRDLRAGLAEVVKYGVIDDPAFFAWLEDHGGDLIAGRSDRLAEAVRFCVTAKARHVAGDVDDRSGQRALLNLGHGFAHAIEAETGLGRVRHGEAVAVGMVLALRLSVRLGQCEAGDVERLVKLLVRFGLPTRLADVGCAGPPLVERMVADKKSLGGRPALVLARGIGRAFLTRDVPVERLTAFLAEA